MVAHEAWEEGKHVKVRDQANCVEVGELELDVGEPAEVLAAERRPLAPRPLAIGATRLESVELGLTAHRIRSKREL